MNGKVIKNVLCGFAVVFFVIAVFCASFLSYFAFKRSSYVAQGNVIVERIGDNYICSLLRNLDISSNKFSPTIVRILRFYGYGSKVGEYKLPNEVSLFAAMKIFSSSKSITHKFTIPEGFSVFQVLERLNKDTSLLGEVQKIPAEGSLMPDTYLFKYPTTKQQIINMAGASMNKFLKREWPKRSPDCILSTPQEALILASIIEKETHKERKKVASVYINRLKAGMRLQACPTVIYSITHGRSLDRKLLLSDLKAKAPHNTYTQKGLPPTPICNPGPESILAVLNPDKTDFLFFVHGKAPNGLFSRTFDEHKKNKIKMKHLGI